MNNKVENPKTEVPKTIDLNNRDYINLMLEIEKNMSVNLSIALNESSNQKLYDDIFKLFKDVKMAQRDLYNLMFKNGWYSLEKSEQQKITEKATDMQNKLSELSN